MIERTEDERSVDLSCEPINGMRIEVRILRNQNFGVAIRFDGTPTDTAGHIRPAEAIVWINAMKALIEEAREVGYELKKEEEAPKPKRGVKKTAKTVPKKRAKK